MLNKQTNKQTCINLQDRLNYYLDLLYWFIIVIATMGSVLHAQLVCLFVCLFVYSTFAQNKGVFNKRLQCWSVTREDKNYRLTQLLNAVTDMIEIISQQQ